MSYITLGNLTRFLTKLKDYLGKNYLKKSGDIATGEIIFEETPKIRGVGATPVLTFIKDNNGRSQVDLIADPDKIQRISYNDQHLPIYRRVLLDSGNYYDYSPQLDGTGATGTWAINISGNALNDSEGNKIVDTYAKKSETSTAPDLTKYMKKSADSSLNMKEYPIYFGYAQISLNDGFVIDGTGDKVKILGTSLFFNNSRIDTREDNQKLYAPQVSHTFTGTVTAPNVTVSTSLTIPGGKVWIA